MNHASKVLLHLVPEHSLVADTQIDFSTVTVPELRPLPQAALGLSQGYDVDATYCHNDWGYTAILRNGIIEAVEGLLTPKGVVYPTELQLELIEGITLYLQLLKRLEIDLPLRTFLTLTGAGETTFPAWSVRSFAGMPGAKREAIELTGPIIDSFDVDVPLAIRPLFDQFWNAFGYPRCLDYDDAGEWNSTRRPVLA